ncbi:unnamed protein product [Amoebophrya sp. A25]|nr:unnamed protein product [Amoebophrya sp. A25]|eukprot:GSA25T00023211001.1
MRRRRTGGKKAAVEDVEDKEHSVSEQSARNRKNQASNHNQDDYSSSLSVVAPSLSTRSGTEADASTSTTSSTENTSFNTAGTRSVKPDKKAATSVVPQAEQERLLEEDPLLAEMSASVPRSRSPPGKRGEHQRSYLTPYEQLLDQNQITTPKRIFSNAAQQGQPSCIEVESSSSSHNPSYRPGGQPGPGGPPAGAASRRSRATMKKQLTFASDLDEPFFSGEQRRRGPPQNGGAGQHYLQQAAQSQNRGGSRRSGVDDPAAFIPSTRDSGFYRSQILQDTLNETLLDHEGGPSWGPGHYTGLDRPSNAFDGQHLSFSNNHPDELLLSPRGESMQDAELASSWRDYSAKLVPARPPPREPAPVGLMPYLRGLFANAIPRGGTFGSETRTERLRRQSGKKYYASSSGNIDSSSERERSGGNNNSSCTTRMDHRTSRDTRTSGIDNEMTRLYHRGKTRSVDEQDNDRVDEQSRVGRGNSIDRTLGGSGNNTGAAQLSTWQMLLGMLRGPISSRSRISDRAKMQQRGAASPYPIHESDELHGDEGHGDHGSEGATLHRTNSSDRGFLRKTEYTPSSYLPELDTGMGFLPWSVRADALSYADDPVEERYVEYADGRNALHFQLDMSNPYEGCSFMMPLTNEEKATHQDTTFVGVAYQITSLGNLDTVLEEMSTGIELSMLFRIKEEDVEFFQERVGEEIRFADLGSRMPAARLLSAPEEPEIISEVIVAVRRCFNRDRELLQKYKRNPVGADMGVDHGGGDMDCWENDNGQQARTVDIEVDEDGEAVPPLASYVQIYGKYRCRCRQVLDLAHFPFSRQLVRLVFVSTTNTFKYIFVPWAYMLPYYEVVEEEVFLAEKEGTGKRRLDSFMKLQSGGSSKVLAFNSEGHAEKQEANAENDVEGGENQEQQQPTGHLGARGSTVSPGTTTTTGSTVMPAEDASTKDGTTGANNVGTTSLKKKKLGSDSNSSTTGAARNSLTGKQVNASGASTISAGSGSHSRNDVSGTATDFLTSRILEPILESDSNPSDHFSPPLWATQSKEKVPDEEDDDYEAAMAMKRGAKTLILSSTGAPTANVDAPRDSAAERSSARSSQFDSVISLGGGTSVYSEGETAAPEEFSGSEDVHADNNNSTTVPAARVSKSEKIRKEGQEGFQILLSTSSSANACAKPDPSTAHVVLPDKSYSFSDAVQIPDMEDPATGGLPTKAHIALIRAEGEASSAGAVRSSFNSINSSTTSRGSGGSTLSQNSTGSSSPNPVGGDFTGSRGAMLGEAEQLEFQHMFRAHRLRGSPAVEALRVTGQGDGTTTVEEATIGEQDGVELEQDVNKKITATQEPTTFASTVLAGGAGASTATIGTSTTNMGAAGGGVAADGAPARPSLLSTLFGSQEPSSTPGAAPYNSVSGETMIPPSSGDGGAKNTAPQPVRRKRYRLIEMRFRPSVFKGRSRLSQSWLCRSHFAEFYPLSWLAAMPSGARYSRFHLVLQMECIPTFYLLNVHFILLCLVSLAFSTFLIVPNDPGSRMQVLLTLLLSLAAYKGSLTSWTPIKPYVTRLDIYVLVAFAFTSIMGFDVMIASVLANLLGDEYIRAIWFVESCIWSPMFLIWFWLHVRLGCAEFFFGDLGGYGTAGSILVFFFFFGDLGGYGTAGSIFSFFFSSAIWENMERLGLYLSYLKKKYAGKGRYQTSRLWHFFLLKYLQKCTF